MTSVVAMIELGASIIFMQLDSHHAEQLNKLVTELCPKHHIHAYAINARRESDIVQFSIWGDRQDVLKFPFAFLQELYDEDIEILQSARRGMHYVLIFVVTESLNKQIMLLPERRTKLRQRSERFEEQRYTSIANRSGATPSAKR